MTEIQVRIHVSVPGATDIDITTEALSGLNDAPRVVDETVERARRIMQEALDT